MQSFDCLVFWKHKWVVVRLKWFFSMVICVSFNLWSWVCHCCHVAVAQINYPSFKHKTQNSIEQAKGRSHGEDSSQIFMLDDMQFWGGWILSRLKQKKTENYQTKFNKIRKLSREQTLVTSTHPPTENQNWSWKRNINLYSEYLSLLNIG